MAKPAGRPSAKRAGNSQPKSGAKRPGVSTNTKHGSTGGGAKRTHRKGATTGAAGAGAGSAKAPKFDRASPGRGGKKRSKGGKAAVAPTLGEHRTYDAPPSRVERPRDDAARSDTPRARSDTPRSDAPRGEGGKRFDARAHYNTPKRFERPAREARAETNADAKARREALAEAAEAALVAKALATALEAGEIEAADIEDAVPTEVETTTETAPASASGEPEGVAFADIPGVHARTAATLEKLGLTTAFPIQAAVIPQGIKGRDLLVQSPTGSGKTLAFGIPIIEQLKIGAFAPVALVLVPTRELAIQVAEDLEPIARGKNCKVEAVYGGAPIIAQARRASRSAIVVATPGRLADLMRSRSLDVSKVRVLVLDEADRMLDMGFQPQVDEIVAELPKRDQTLLFSATLEGAVGKIAKAYTHDAEIVRNERKVGAGGSIDHVLLATTASTKVDTVLDALDDAARDLAVIFVRTKHGADRLCERLREYGHRSTVIHGGMNQAQRKREYRRFQDADCDVLVATDVFARGMDLDRITHVVHYDIPEDGDTWRHRAGRTGRAGRNGTSIVMVMPHQKRAVKQMLVDAGLPVSTLDEMRKSSGKHWKQVPVEERFTDRGFAYESRGGGNGGKGKRFEGRNDRNSGASSSAGASYGEVEGTIASYVEEKGFGFITPDNGGADVFFHKSMLLGGSGSVPRRGATVAFELEEHNKGERAGRVRLTGGASTGRQSTKPSHKRPDVSRDRPKVESYGKRNGKGHAGPSAPAPKARRAWS